MVNATDRRFRRPPFLSKKRAFFVIQSWYPFGTADDHSAASPMNSAEFSPPARGWAFLRRFSVSLTEQNPAYAGMDPEVELSSRRTKAEPRLRGGCPVFAPWGFSVGLFCGCIAGGRESFRSRRPSFFKRRRREIRCGESVSLLFFAHERRGGGAVGVRSILI